MDKEIRKLKCRCCRWYYDKFNGFHACEAIDCEDSYASALYTAEIDPETIGQYTGIVDKYGMKIFEGDIVWNDYDNGKGKVEWDNDMAKFIITFSTFTIDFDNIYGDELDVIGNVYDNPELLKGGI